MRLFVAGNGEFPPAAGAASLDCGQSPRHDSAAGREISSWFCLPAVLHLLYLKVAANAGAQTRGAGSANRF